MLGGQLNPELSTLLSFLIARWQVGPHIINVQGFDCWIFYSGIQLHILFNSYLCFISFLYLNLK